MNFQLFLQILVTAAAVTPVVFGMVWGMVRYVGSDTKTRLDIHIAEDAIKFAMLQASVDRVEKMVGQLVDHLLND